MDLDENSIHCIWKHWIRSNIEARQNELLITYGAVWTYKPTHILNNTKNFDVDLFAKIELFAYIRRGHSLWCGDNDCTIYGGIGKSTEVLSKRNVFVRCAYMS